MRHMQKYYIKLVHALMMLAYHAKCKAFLYAKKYHAGIARAYYKKHGIFATLVMHSLIITMFAGTVLFAMPISTPVDPVDLKVYGWNGICESCILETKTSKIYHAECVHTLAYCGGGYYDEAGKYVEPINCNYTVCKYTCDKGHVFYGKK